MPDAPNSIDASSDGSLAHPIHRPPVAKQVPHEWRRPTGEIDDHFAWLADPDDPDTLAYLTAENAYTEQWFAPHRGVIDSIYAEIRERTQETDLGDPVPVDDWFYVVSTTEGAAYPAFYRGRTATDARDQLVLDLNIESGDSEYFDLGTFDVSPDHELVAWSSDDNGDEHYVLRFREIATGTDLADQLTDTASAGSAWASDRSALWYVVADEQERPYRVMRHRLGTDQSTDEVVYTETDESFFVGIGSTRNNRAVIIHCGSKTSSETWLLDPNEPAQPARCVRPREPDVEYQVDHWGDRLAIVTNLDAVDYRVMTAALDDTTAWVEFVPHQPGRRIAGLEAFNSFLALYEWAHGQERIRIVGRDGHSQTLDIDSAPHEVGFGANEQWDTTVVRLQHQSLVQPPRIIDVSIDGGDITVIKQRPTPNVDLDHYRSKRLWATTSDGARVPVDVAYHRDTPLDGTAPCTVYGYGSYEISIAPWFSVGRLSLLDRGHVWALAHPRGGGEMGREWYLHGKLLEKKNTFTDTLAVTELLGVEHVADPDRVAIRGGSAGGLLVGACITMRPDMFAAAIAEVPFVDVVTTMSDPSLPLTVTEWEEWGDPRREPYASYIASYSPYDNTVPADYPAIYITAGLNDPRVSYHEPAKWTARLREVGQGTRPVLLKTELGAGHGGPTGRYDAWRDEAQTLAFTLVALGSTDSSPSAAGEES